MLLTISTGLSYESGWPIRITRSARRSRNSCCRTPTKLWRRFVGSLPTENRRNYGDRDCHAPDGGERNRRNGSQMARQRRRRRARGSAASGDLDRQGRHRDPGADRRRSGKNSGARRRDLPVGARLAILEPKSSAPQPTPPQPKTKDTFESVVTGSEPPANLNVGVSGPTAGPTEPVQPSSKPTTEGEARRVPFHEQPQPEQSAVEHQEQPRRWSPVVMRMA